jgi:hypothetical protein
MGIWGTSSPLIKVVSSSVEIALSYSVIQANKASFDRLEQKNPISSNKQFITKGYWWIFEVLTHLYRHGAETYNKYIELAELLHTDVYIKPYSDHDFLQNASGDVEFYFASLRPVELTTVNYETGLFCRFESKDYVDISLSAAA